MLKYAREKDLALFVHASGMARPKTQEDLPLRVVVPAYMLSELKAGFQIGAVLFLPFLLVDIVVASITTSVGMMQLPPVVVSTPIKIFLFVMVDGWNMLANSLLEELLVSRRAMGPDQVTELMRMLLKEALIISAPVLLLATVISVIVSLTLTLISLQDQTLSQVPRLAIVGVALLVGAPWIIRRLAYYTIGLLSDFHRFVR